MPNKFGKIITFYSYKGGTGRSMVLANVAYLLAKSEHVSKGVLVIDWDLEAPGLQSFFYNRFQKQFGSSTRPSYAAELNGAQGLIDFLTDVKTHYRKSHPLSDDGKLEALPESTADQALTSRIFEEALEKHPLKKYRLDLDELPMLSVMKAGSQQTDRGDEDTYWTKVKGFDWSEFYRQYGSFFTHFREHLMKTFDFVLIDSRTGLTDIGGICTRVMPETLVAVFAPNHQNIAGVERVVRKSVGYRRRSRDPRPLSAFPLASRIDASASRLRKIWWRGGELGGEQITGYQATFEKLFKELYELEECDLGPYFDATQVPHDSDFAYGESVAAMEQGTEDRFSIGHACEELMERLVQTPFPWEPLGTSEARGGVYVSYRRKDSAHQARLLHDALVERVGAGWVYMDVDHMAIGTSFRETMAAMLDRAALMLVVIGPEWLSTGSSETPTIADPGDFVHHEIAEALRRDMRIVPLLVDNAKMPRPEVLPPDLFGLMQFNAFEITNDQWDVDLAGLFQALDDILPSAQILTRWELFVRILKRFWKSLREALSG